MRQIFQVQDVVNLYLVFSGFHHPYHDQVITTNHYKWVNSKHCSESNNNNKVTYLELNNFRSKFLNILAIVALSQLLQKLSNLVSEL